MFNKIRRKKSKVDEDIEKYGVHGIHVLGDDIGPRFSYTIGLYKQYHHPEVIITGLNKDTSFTIFINIANNIKDGIYYNIEDEYADLIDRKCKFIKVDKLYYQQYVGQAINYYRNTNFPLFQLVWPDENNNYPDEKDFTKDLIWHQPMLN